MRPPAIGRWQLAIVAVTLAPLAFNVAVVLAFKARFGKGWGRLDGNELVLVYMGVLGSAGFAAHFRRPLVDPASRWGIFGRRERPRMTLRWMLVYVAAIAPLFAIQAHTIRQHERESRARREQQITWYDEQIQGYEKDERVDLARAGDDERSAEDCRRRAERGEPQKGGRSWREQAEFHARMAAFWAKQARWAAGMRKQVEAMRDETTSGR